MLLYLISVCVFKFLFESLNLYFLLLILKDGFGLIFVWLKIFVECCFIFNGLILIFLFVVYIEMIFLCLVEIM